MNSYDNEEDWLDLLDIDQDEVDYIEKVLDEEFSEYLD